MLPMSTTCEVSTRRAVATFSSSTVTTSVSPDLATLAPRACTYSGNASVPGTAIGRGAVPGRSNAR